MGAFSCCLNNDGKYTTKIYELNSDDTRIEKPKSQTNGQNYPLMRKRSYFDRKDFINMKTTSLFEEYEINDKLGEGKLYL